MSRTWKNTYGKPEVSKKAGLNKMRNHHLRLRKKRERELDRHRCGACGKAYCHGRCEPMSEQELQALLRFCGVSDEDWKEILGLPTD